jgi:hypothetical protein
MKINRFEDLECWQEARIIVNRIYCLGRLAGLKSDFTLVDQIKEPPSH